MIVKHRFTLFVNNLRYILLSVVLRVFMADSEQIGFRCPKNIAIAFKKKLEDAEQEKTEYLVALLAKDLGIEQPLTLSDRMELAEIKIACIEKKIEDIETRLDA